MGCSVETASRSSFVKSIDHIGLIVKDMEKAVKFYTDVMGFTLIGEITPWAGSAEESEAMQVQEGTLYRCAMVKGPGDVNIQFMEFDHMQDSMPLNVQGAHYLTYMVDDMDAWVKKLVDNGCKLMSKPLMYDEFGTTVQWCYVIDPNGIIFELTSAT